MGVIISGLFVVWLNIYWIDGLVALMIAAYMIYQSVLSFPKVVNILMNAAPDGLDLAAVEKALLKIDGVRDVHHLHIWSVNENDVSLECHIVADNLELVQTAAKLLNKEFGITHCNIQIENCADCADCCL